MGKLGFFLIFKPQIGGKISQIPGTSSFAAPEGLMENAMMAVQTEYWKSYTMPQKATGKIPQMAGSGACGASRASSNSFSSFCPKKYGRKFRFSCLVSRRFGGSGGWFGGIAPVATPHIGDKTNPIPHWPLVKKQKVEKIRKKPWKSFKKSS